MDTESCGKLTHRIPTRSGLRKLTGEELELLHTEHELEIVKITGQISVTSNHQWATSAKQAKRILALHKTWIEREQRGREAEARLALKEKNKAFVKAISESTAASKAERIRLANEKDMRDIGVFKTVCREVVGDEMYQHIWQLTNQRIGA